MKKIIVGLLSSVAFMALLMFVAGPGPDPSAAAIPRPTLKSAEPLTEMPNRMLAVWTIEFSRDALIAEAVSHVESRQVWVTKGAMAYKMGDAAWKSAMMGEMVTIPAGVMHQWKNAGTETGELVTIGVVSQDKLHDACGGAG